MNLLIRYEPMGQNANLCRVDLTPSPAQLPRFAVFMTIAPIICMCAIAKFWAWSKCQFSNPTPKPPILRIIASRMVSIRLTRQPLAMGQTIWRCCKPPAWLWSLRASHCCWPKWQSSLTILISAACYIFKAIKSMISSQIKFRGSIYPIQIKGAETGPFVFDIKTWHLPFRIEGTAYFLAKLI